ncbi:MAG TPA: hypothetical protein VHA78_00970 [Candidatus Peribacteraceae bacterium]|nr:hypothetical protein [Candidatus Peribacteraceae bacterium]
MVRRSTEREILEQNAVERQRLETHDAIFNKIGSAAGTGMDILEGTSKVGVFTVGRVIHGVGRTVQAAVHGLMGKPYPQKKK